MSGRETEYVLLEAMTAQDFAWNIRRLRKRGHTAHADTLEAYGRERLLPLAERVKLIRLLSQRGRP
jgi:hypothetical protein